MAIRTGMQNLVDRVRALTGAGTAEYVAGTITYWTDNHIQDALDSNARHFVAQPLVWQPEQIGGTLNYFVAYAPYRDLEETPGTAVNSRFVIRDGAGSAIATALYTPNYRSGEISFGTINQGGTAYYLTGYSYDVCAAAADVLRERLVNFNSYFDWSADNQSIKRSQVRANIRATIDDLRGCIGENIIGATSGDMHTSEFVRVDLNASDSPWGWY